MKRSNQNNSNHKRAETGKSKNRAWLDCDLDQNNHGVNFTHSLKKIGLFAFATTLVSVAYLAYQEINQPVK